MQDGEEQERFAVARPRREPTSWTKPLRYAVAVYLGGAVVQWVVTTVLFLNTADMARSLKAQDPNLTADELRAAANFAIGLGWLATMVVVILMLLLGVGSLRGWRWAFWAALAWLALSSLGIITNTLGLLDPAVESQPPGAVLFSLFFALVALGLGIWCAVAATLYGPWAMRKVSR
jgi:hypothetical protein